MVGSASSRPVAPGDPSLSVVAQGRAFGRLVAEVAQALAVAHLLNLPTDGPDLITNLESLLLYPQKFSPTLSLTFRRPLQIFQPILLPSLPRKAEIRHLLLQSS